MKSKKNNILKLLIITLGIMGIILCVFLLPWLNQYMIEKNSEFISIRYHISGIIYITAIPFYIALYQAYNILKQIERKNAFSQHSLNSLKYIKNCAFLITVAYIIWFIILLFLNIVYISIIITFIIIIFAATIVALLAAVLQELLAQALKIKEENSLTV